MTQRPNKWTSLYTIGEDVFIDGDKSIKAVILRVVISSTTEPYDVMYDVSWFSQGNLNTSSVDEWRLSPWEE